MLMVVMVAVPIASLKVAVTVVEGATTAPLVGTLETMPGTAHDICGTVTMEQSSKTAPTSKREQFLSYDMLACQTSAAYIPESIKTGHTKKAAE
jgi:hypothetical protein